MPHPKRTWAGLRHGSARRSSGKRRKAEEAKVAQRSEEVPLEVRQLRRAVHQFGLVGGEDYDSKEERLQQILDRLPADSGTSLVFAKNAQQDGSGDGRPARGQSREQPQLLAPYGQHVLALLEAAKGRAERVQAVLDGAGEDHASVWTCGRCTLENAWMLEECTAPALVSFFCGLELPVAAQHVHTDVEDAALLQLAPCPATVLEAKAFFLNRCEELGWKAERCAAEADDLFRLSPVEKPFNAELICAPRGLAALDAADPERRAERREERQSRTGRWNEKDKTKEENNTIDTDITRKEDKTKEMTHIVVNNTVLGDNNRIYLVAGEDNIIGHSGNDVPVTFTSGNWVNFPFQSGNDINVPFNNGNDVNVKRKQESSVEGNDNVVDQKSGAVNASTGSLTASSSTNLEKSVEGPPRSLRTSSSQGLPAGAEAGAQPTAPVGAAEGSMPGAAVSPADVPEGLMPWGPEAAGEQPFVPADVPEGVMPWRAESAGVQPAAPADVPEGLMPWTPEAAGEQPVAPADVPEGLMPWGPEAAVAGTAPGADAGAEAAGVQPAAPAHIPEGLMPLGDKAAGVQPAAPADIPEGWPALPRAKQAPGAQPAAATEGPSQRFADALRRAPPPAAPVDVAHDVHVAQSGPAPHRAFPKVSVVAIDEKANSKSGALQWTPASAQTLGPMDWILINYDLPKLPEYLRRLNALDTLESFHPRFPRVVYTFLEEAQLKTRACKDLVELLKSTRKYVAASKKAEIDSALGLIEEEEEWEEESDCDPMRSSRSPGREEGEDEDWDEEDWDACDCAHCRGSILGSTSYHPLLEHPDFEHKAMSGIEVVRLPLKALEDFDKAVPFIAPRVTGHSCTLICLHCLNVHTPWDGWEQFFAPGELTGGDHAGGAGLGGWSLLARVSRLRPPGRRRQRVDRYFGYGLHGPLGHVAGARMKLFLVAVAATSVFVAEGAEAGEATLMRAKMAYFRERMFARMKDVSPEKTTLKNMETLGPGQRGFSSAELEQACWSSHSWAEAVKSLSTTHVECRNEQNAAWMDYDTTCILARQIQENERIALCNAFQAANIFPNPATTCSMDEGTKVPTIGNYLGEMAKFFRGEYDILYEKKMKCLLDFSLGLLELCKEKICLYYDQKIACDEKQKAMEEKACQLHKTYTCALFGECYTEKVELYDGIVTLAKDCCWQRAESEEALQSEWQAVLRIECLVKALGMEDRSSEESGDSEVDAGITACKEKGYSTEEVAFNYKGDAPAARTCTDVFLQPGTAVFSNHWYSGLPSNTPAESCDTWLRVVMPGFGAHNSCVGALMGRSVHVLLCVGLGPALRGDAQRASCASMLQTAVGRGLQENASFARELRELYLEQLSFEQTLQRTKRRMVQEPDLPDARMQVFGEQDTNITGEIAAGASSVTDAISARAQSLMNYMNDHTVGKILIYWFGPDAAWSCVPSTVSSGLVCGYFGGWLGMYGICFILTLPVWLIACYFMTYILSLVLTSPTLHIGPCSMLTMNRVV
eukprot:g1828.t1